MAPILRYEDYRIAWIAVLPIETEAAVRMFDRRHDGHFESLPGDSTSSLFIGGEICGHNVVIATWPIGQSYGIGSAAELATDVRRRFRNIWFALLVGVAAGIPNLSDDPLQRRDIRLGDVLVCVPDQLSPGIVQYDHGKYTSSDGGIKFTPTGRQAQTDAVIRRAFGYIKYTSEFPFEDGNECAQYLKAVQPPDRPSKFDCPPQEHDILLATRSADTSEAMVVPRPKRPDSCRTYVWYGRIGSGNALVKSARKRDQLRDDYGIIGLEMEAAGTMNILPAGVIRGVCDYADGQKDKRWQPYAAAAAAAYAKCILHHTTPHKRQASDRPLKPLKPVRRNIIDRAGRAHARTKSGSPLSKIGSDGDSTADDADAEGSILSPIKSKVKTATMMAERSQLDRDLAKVDARRKQAPLANADHNATLSVRTNAPYRDRPPESNASSNGADKRPANGAQHPQPNAVIPQGDHVDNVSQNEGSKDAPVHSMEDVRSAHHMHPFNGRESSSPNEPLHVVLHAEGSPVIAATEPEPDLGVFAPVSLPSLRPARRIYPDRGDSAPSMIERLILENERERVFPEHERAVLNSKHIAGDVVQSQLGEGAGQRRQSQHSSSGSLSSGDGRWRPRSSRETPSRNVPNEKNIAEGKPKSSGKQRVAAAAAIATGVLSLFRSTRNKTRKDSQTSKIDHNAHDSHTDSYTESDSLDDSTELDRGRSRADAAQVPFLGGATNAQMTRVNERSPHTSQAYEGDRYHWRAPGKKALAAMNAQSNMNQPQPRRQVLFKDEISSNQPHNEDMPEGRAPSPTITWEHQRLFEEWRGRRVPTVPASGEEQKVNDESRSWSTAAVHRFDEESQRGRRGPDSPTDPVEYEIGQGARSCEKTVRFSNVEPRRLTSASPPRQRVYTHVERRRLPSSSPPRHRVYIVGRQRPRSSSWSSVESDQSRRADETGGQPSSSRGGNVVHFRDPNTKQIEKRPRAARRESVGVAMPARGPALRKGSSAYNGGQTSMRRSGAIRETL